MFNKPTNGVTTNYPQQIGRLIDLAEGPALRNFIRNGDFQIAQRGTSFAGLTTSQYTLDGIYFASDPSGTNTFSQQAFSVGQTAVPGNPRNFLRIDRTVAAGAANAVVRFPIEMPDRLSGKTMTMSFWAKVSSGTKALAVDAVFTGVTPGAYVSIASFTATTTWTNFKFTWTVETMSAATSSAAFWPRIAELSGFSTFTLDIADVQLELGSEATYFDRLGYLEQEQWAQRFFAKSFPRATAPAQNAGENGAHAITCVGGSKLHTTWVVFPVRMRAAPTPTFYNPSAANAQMRDSVGAVDYSSTTATQTSDSGCIVTATSNAGSVLGADGLVHWSATAEL